jgi:hypothetical protein
LAGDAPELPELQGAAGVRGGDALVENERWIRQARRGTKAAEEEVGGKPFRADPFPEGPAVGATAEPARLGQPRPNRLERRLEELALQRRGGAGTFPRRFGLGLNDTETVEVQNARQFGTEDDRWWPATADGRQKNRSP